MTRTAAAAACLLAIGTAWPAARPAAGGTIIGVVSTKETSLPDLRVTTDPEVCGRTLPDESISVDGAGHVRGVVLTVAGTTGGAPGEAVIANTGCRFVPRLSILRPKGAVKMSSSDRVMHTMHAAGADGRALFNLSLPLPNVTLSRPVDKPGAVTLSCSTHTWMRGYIFVTDELSAVSGSDGTFRLDGVPAGVRQLRVWHETLRAAPVQVTVKDGETVGVELTLTKTG